MNLKLARTILVIGSLAVFGVTEALGNDDQQPPPANALQGASVTLDDGLRASELAGKPISAKFEVEDGRLQLSVYVVTDTGYAEAIIAPDTGVLMSLEKMTDADDLADADAQSEAMQQAAIPLRIAIEKAIANNREIRAVSVVPEMKAGRPEARVTVLAGQTFTTTWQPLR